MNNNKVLILAPSEKDPQAEFVAAAVRELGGTAVYTTTALTADNKYMLGQGKTIWNGFDLSDVRSIYLRCQTFSIHTLIPGYLSQAEWTAHRAQHMFEAQRQAATFSMLEYLSDQGLLVVNLPRCYQEHASKTAMYLKLKAKGFTVPETIMTSDPAAAADFTKQHPSVAKLGAGIGSTREVVPQDRERFADLYKAPAIFQQKIPGHTIRVHVIGNRVGLALRVKSRETDSRTDPKGFSVENLPPPIESDIIRATHELGAHFAAWDIILADDGQAYLLDFNPGPYIWWIGAAAAQAVLLELARLLYTYAQTHSLNAAYEAPQQCRLTSSSWNVKPEANIREILERNEQIRRARLRISQ